MPELAPGARFKLNDYAGPMLRPLGSRTGVIVADANECWKVRFDGVVAHRWIFKPYCQAETPAEVAA